MKPLISAAIALFALGACKSTDVPLGGAFQIVADIPPEPISDLDILFVIDDSGSMTPHQQALIASARASLFEQLAAETGDLPNLHIGVISTDLGAGAYNISGCWGSGDDGRLLLDPDRCPGIDGSFLVDVDDGAGGRLRNYAGELADAFGCIAHLGNQGCGFEQPLEAIRRALDGSRPENDGFLRDEAMLLIVVLSDEDDCSMADLSVFDPASASPDSELGPFTSFRCFEHAVVCDPDDPRVDGVKVGCVPREDGPYPHSVQGYIDFLTTLKADPTRVMVAGIYGPTDWVEVIPHGALGGGRGLANVCGEQPPCPPFDPSGPDAGVPDAAPSDGGGTGGGDPGMTADAGPVCGQGTVAPAIRLGAVGEAFPARYEFASICGIDMSTKLRRIATSTGTVMAARPCLLGQVTDTDPTRAGIQPTCRVFDVVAPRTGNERRTELRACADTGDAAPCYAIAPDAAQCGGTPTQLAVDVRRRAPAAPDTHVVVQCLLAAP